LSLKETDYREAGLYDIIEKNNVPAYELNFRIRAEF